MRIVSSLLLLVVIIMGVSFACLNAQEVSMNIYIKTFQIPLSLLLVLVLGLGIIIGYFVIGCKILRLKRENARLKSKVKLAEREVENLRAIPLKDTH